MLGDRVGVRLSGAGAAVWQEILHDVSVHFGTAVQGASIQVKVFS